MPSGCPRQAFSNFMHEMHKASFGFQPLLQVDVRFTEMLILLQQGTISMN